MKLHSDVIAYTGQVRRALEDAKYGYPYHVASDIGFVVGPEPRGSRKRSHGYEIQLGTYDSTTGPTKSRHYKNSGKYGADTIYAATYDEWGWFIAHIFVADPNAIFGPYEGVDDFNAKTKDAYKLPVSVS